MVDRVAPSLLACLALSIVACGSIPGAADTDSEGVEGSSGDTSAGSGPTTANTQGMSSGEASTSLTSSTSGSQDDSSDTSDDGSTTGPDVPPVDCEAFAQSIEADALMGHLAQLQAIADEHGNRSAGRPGFDASIEYVENRLAAAGYGATAQAFETVIYETVTPTVFSRDGSELESGDDYYTPRYSGAVSVTAEIVPVDIELGLGNDNSSGCEMSDFSGFPEGAIALVQRGDCSNQDKIENAAAAGAGAVVLFNQGDQDGGGRQNLFIHVMPPSTDHPPVLITTYDAGAALSSGGTGTIEIDNFMDERTTHNLIVERAGTDDGQVVMFGAHLDSVPAGPGINDNGTGSMALLAIAERLAQCQPERTVRFAWWGAEELGLFGSQHYVDELSDEQRDELMFYLNFDMIGSPNFVRFVHDGDGSDDGSGGPPGSDSLERFFEDHFDDLGLPLEPARFSSRSDYNAFLRAGIATGGLFTGASANKNAGQAAAFGGEEGEPMDPCYHLECDRDETINVEEYERIGIAVAASVQHFGIEGAGFSSEAPPAGAVTIDGGNDVFTPGGCGHLPWVD